MLRILIVDDEPNIRLLLRQTLEDFLYAGVELLEAANGETALELIRSKRPKLVFLDVMMPGMDGFEVCRKVKQELGLHRVCITMLTARGHDGDIQKGADVGADMYLTKPFDPDGIVEIVKIVLGLRKGG